MNEDDVLWKVSLSLMKKYCGWKVIHSRDAIIYTFDGSIENSFVKRKNVIDYMFEQNSAVINDNDKTLSLHDKLWDIVYHILHEHERWIHTLNSRIIHRREHQEPMVFTSKKDVLTFLQKRERAKEEVVLDENVKPCAEPMVQVSFKGDDIQAKDVTTVSATNDNTQDLDADGMPASVDVAKDITPSFSPFSFGDPSPVVRGNNALWATQPFLSGSSAPKPVNHFSLGTDTMARTRRIGKARRSPSRRK